MERVECVAGACKSKPGRDRREREPLSPESKGILVTRTTRSRRERTFDAGATRSRAFGLAVPRQVGSRSLGGRSSPVPSRPACAAQL
jgi:hypothetical protein